MGKCRDIGSPGGTLEVGSGAYEGTRTWSPLARDEAADVEGSGPTAAATC
jgi:hypothetical protein